MFVPKKFIFGLILFSNLEFKLFGAQAEDLDKAGGDGCYGGASGRERTDSELRHRARSKSGRGDSKGSDLEMTTSSPDVPILRDMLPRSVDILNALVTKDHVKLNLLVQKFVDPRAHQHFPTHIPYDSSFAIYAVQTRQLEALNILAQVEDFTRPDQIRRTPMSVARELVAEAEKRHDSVSADGYRQVVAIVDILEKAQVGQHK